MLLAAIPASAQVAESLTLDQARALSTGELARHLLGASGALAKESSVISGFPPFTAADRLYGVEFASAPRSAGFPGLCEADVYTVDLAPLENAAGSVVRRVQVQKRYRVVGDLEPLPDMWNDAYGSRLDALCAGAAPVLARGHRFFAGGVRQSSDFWPTHASFAARALAKARAWIGPIGCTDERKPDAPLCAKPATLLRPLDSSTLGYFAIDPCKDAPLTYCVSATFQPDSHETHHAVTLTIATDTTVLSGPVAGFALRWVTVEGASFVN